MVATMVMDTMASLVATGMETVVTGIVVIEVQDVIGDEIEGQGESLFLVEAFPLQWRYAQPDNPDVPVPAPLQISVRLSSRKAGLRVGRRSPL